MGKLSQCLPSMRNLGRESIFQNPTFLLTVWLGCVFAAFLAKFSGGINNNYFIFSHSFGHALAGQPLYAEYPGEYEDLFLYGIPFTGLVAPFAVLPNILGSLLWRLANVYLLYWAVRQLRFRQWSFAFIILFSVNELYTALLAYQYNIAIAGLIILSFALIEQKKDFWAGVVIMLGFMTKIYGIVGLAFFLFSKNKLQFLLGILCGGVFLFLFPMLYTSPQYVVNSYHEWFQVLLYKNDLNQFCDYTNVSLLGMVRKISNMPDYSDLWLIIPGLILFTLPYCRIQQYRNRGFRLLYLSSTLLFMVLFSTGTEGWGYIAAIIAVAIWYVSTPTRKSMSVLNTSLLIFCFILTSLSPTDIFSSFIKKTYVVPYALKALPCALIWFKVVWEQLTQNFDQEEEL